MYAIGPNGSRRSRRVLWAIYYACFVGAGAASLFDPSQTVVLALHGAVVLWALFYIVGGLAALVGTLVSTRIGEVVGLPLVAGASALYAVSIYIQVIASGDFSYLTAGVVLTSQAILLVDRWLSAMATVRQGRDSGGS